jgi:hypothetical protein
VAATCPSSLAQGPLAMQVWDAVLLLPPTATADADDAVGGIGSGDLGLVAISADIHRDAMGVLVVARIVLLL